MNQSAALLHQPKAPSLPIMVFLSIFGHAAAILFFLILPGLLPSRHPEPFGGGPGNSGNVLWVSSSAIGRMGKPAEKELTQEEPAPAKFIKKATAEDDVPLPSKTEFPDEVKKKPKDEPTAKETLNQPERKKSGEYGKGKDTSEDAGKSGTEGKGKTGVGIGIGGPGAGGESGTGTGIPFPYPWYVEIVKTKIELNWRKPYLEQSSPKEYVTTVYFVIQRNGQVTNIKTEEPSGIGALDRSKAQSSEQHPSLHCQINGRNRILHSV
jgi:TonB C terminal